MGTGMRYTDTLFFLTSKSRGASKKTAFEEGVHVIFSGGNQHSKFRRNFVEGGAWLAEVGY